LIRFVSLKANPSNAKYFPKEGYGRIVAFEAKTKLIGHYKLTLKAELFAGNKMFIDENPALSLVEKYFNK